jgi:hypothetical protein
MAGLPRDAVHALIGAGVHAVIHLQRSPRAVGEIHLVQPSPSSRAITVPALVRRDGRLVPAEGADKLAELIRVSGGEVPPWP